VFLWRISKYLTLDGRGGLEASARWHNVGRPVVYLSENPASALLEILVHLELKPNELPSGYKLLQVHVPDQVRPAQLEISKLPENWKGNEAVTRRFGDLWLDGNSAALLEVPSALVLHTNNFLLNPQHKEASSITIVSVEPLAFDERLLR